MQIDRDKRRAAQTDTNGKHVEAVETEQRFGESYIVQHRRGSRHWVQHTADDGELPTLRCSPLSSPRLSNA